MAVPALSTDLYELTMAAAYLKGGTAEKESVFHLSFRSNPFQGGFIVACGLETALEYLASYRFEKEDLDYLATLSGNDGKKLFSSRFLEYLSNLRVTCAVDAVPEGTVVFPMEPVLRVQGPLLQAQLLETALLNILNFQSLIATKAARVCLAAEGAPVIEFGLRRAQGPDGGLSASRAAYVGGCAGTSNVAAGKRFGIPVKGTMAHSFVMSFATEADAFESYLQAMPGNAVLLVDTYDSLQGVRNAVAAGKALRRMNHELAGIRLDSGDLAYLSQEARLILDAEGFPRTAIMASNELDEYLIESLKQQGAAIDIWGVGTNLATGGNQSALGGVYKLSSVRDHGSWRRTLKISEQAEKTSFPGIQQVRRYRSANIFIGDMIYDLEAPIPQAPLLIDPVDANRRKQIPPDADWEDLLVPVFRAGEIFRQSPNLESIRARTQSQLSQLHSGIKRFRNPHRYPAGLEPSLHALRRDLIEKIRSESHAFPEAINGKVT